jgi:hypothetical protein
MSSTYYILCLSHDPAITVNDPGYNRPEQAEEAIRDRPSGHEHCDLMIGRYSSPLVELGCPTTRDQPANLACCHSGTLWTSKNWLLLLAAAYQTNDPNIQQAIKTGYHGCLPWERLKRLRTELDLTIKEPRP